MARVKFKKGMQRKFLKNVLNMINCPSLRELINRGFEIPYSTLKNYFNESRSLPKDFFNDLCYMAGINPDSLEVEYLNNNWGQIKGGKTCRKE